MTSAPRSSRAVALERSDFPTPAAIGHRVVHGGLEHVARARDAGARHRSARARPVRVLHLPAALACIDRRRRARGVPQVACFDTAFHRSMPPSQRLPLPRAVDKVSGATVPRPLLRIRRGDGGARRSGAVSRTSASCSLTAVRDGTSVDTTMGFTPTGGVMMGTRTGDLDPGVLVHLLTHEGHDAAALERLVDHESGLLGVSGTTSDMQTLVDQRATNPAAAEAIELFCHQVRKHVGALAAVLGGLDTLVFTGGIGEHRDEVRAEVCRGLEHLRDPDRPDRNARHDAIVGDGACTVQVVPTDEDLMIARHARRALRGLSMVVVVMGVSGSGKTTVGQALAARLGWSFRGCRRPPPAGERRQDAPRDSAHRRGSRGRGFTRSGRALRQHVTDPRRRARLLGAPPAPSRRHARPPFPPAPSASSTCRARTSRSTGVCAPARRAFHAGVALEESARRARATRRDRRSSSTSHRRFRDRRRDRARASSGLMRNAVTSTLWRRRSRALPCS